MRVSVSHEFPRFVRVMKSPLVAPARKTTVTPVVPAAMVIGPVRTTMLTALVPGLSALGAVAVLGEPMHWNLLAGLALVTGGILLGVLVKPAATGGTR